LKQIATRRTVRDFRTAKEGRVGEFPPLLPKPEFAEIEAGSTREETESYSVSTFARAEGLSHEAMINDDLGMIEQFVRSVAMSVTDLEARLLTELLTTNPVMGDGNALFSTEHGNTYDTPAALSPGSLSSLRLLMRQQKGVNGQ